jgi:exopolysaccharide production protein ExoZ
MKYRLQYLRAIAALLVVIWHASYHLWDTRGTDVMLARTPAVLTGALGVALFFVISGYLMSTLAGRNTAGQFMLHRIIRIYPIYWIVLACFLIINRLLGYGVSIDPLALALMPGEGRGYSLGVEWTLPFELSFYFIVFVIILLRQAKALPIIGVVWAAIIVALLQFMPGLQHGQFPRLSQIFVSQWTLPFALGLVVPAIVEVGVPTTLTFLLGIVFAGLAQYQQAYASLFLPLAGLCFVHWAVVPRPKAEDAKRAIPTLTRLGDWSYALYLCHVPITLWLFRLTPASWSAIGVWLVAIVLSVVVAAGMGTVDLGLYRTLKKWVDTRSATTLAVLGPLFAVLLASYGAVSEVHAWRGNGLTVYVNDLGRKLATSQPRTAEDFSAAGARVNLSADPTLRGYVDNITCKPDGSVEVSGWAANTQTGSSGVAVMVFSDGRYWGSIVPKIDRADVTRSLKLHTLFDTPGFSAVFKEQDCGTVCDHLTAIAAKDNTYMVLPVASRTGKCAM